MRATVVLCVTDAWVTRGTCVVHAWHYRLGTDGLNQTVTGLVVMDVADVWFMRGTRMAQVWD